MEVVAVVDAPTASNFPRHLRALTVLDSHDLNLLAGSAFERTW